MTNNEAIETLRANYPDACFEQLREAVDKAIEALTAQEQLSNNLPELDKENGELIRRKATIEALKEAFNPSITNFVKAKMAIDKLPSAQPERKTGRWLPDNRPGGGFWVCSECKFPSEAFAANVLYKFCPHCGAYMGGDTDGDMPD